MSLAAHRELLAALRSVDDDPEIRCIVLTGAGDRAFVAGGAYTANDTVYLECTIYDARIDGGGSPTPLATAIGKITGDYATGDWVDGQEAFTIGLGVELAADHRLAAVWTQHGGGAACPGGSFRTT